MTYDLNYCTLCNKSPCKCNVPILKSCSFCGSRRVALEHNTKYFVMCSRCGMQGPSFKTKTAAAHAWNELTRLGK